MKSICVICAWDMIHFSLKVVFFCKSIVSCAKCSALFAPKCSLRRSRGVRTASWVSACVALAASTMSGLWCAPDCTSTSNFQLFQYLCPRLHKCFQLPNSNFFNICDCTVSNSNLSKILDTLRCCHLLFAWGCLNVKIITFSCSALQPEQLLSLF